MKRTPPWVWVAAAAVQIAALGLCVWVMERHVVIEDAGAPELEPPAPRPALRADGAQVLHGGTSQGTVRFGFYPDGSVRAVDADGARYAGDAANARARMREVGGTRAFTVQIGAGDDGRLRVTFTGGLHDGETIALDPLVGGTVV